MQLDTIKLKVDRDVFDRRDGLHAAPPYLTDEGFVLIDRRAALERRADARQSVILNMDSTSKAILR